MINQNPHTKKKTLEEVREEFRRAGVSYKAWAEANNFSYNVVRYVIRGINEGIRGEAHRVAVALGLKDGDVVTADQFLPAPVRMERVVRTRRPKVAA